MPLEHDDELLDSLPELDSDGDDPTGTEDDPGELELVEAAEGESVGLDDSTGAHDPVDPEWLDPLPEDAAARVEGETRTADFDLADEIDDEESQSWLDGGGGDKSWDADLSVAEEPPAYEDDGGALGLDDPVQLPEMEDDPELRIDADDTTGRRATQQWDGNADESGGQSG